jgi:hypothetical protein
MPVGQRTRVVSRMWNPDAMRVFYRLDRAITVGRSCLLGRIALDFSLRTSDLYLKRHFLGKFCRMLERRNVVARLVLIVNTPTVPEQLYASLVRCTWLTNFKWYQDYGELPYDPRHPELFDTRNVPSVAATLRQVLPRLATCANLVKLSVQHDHIGANDLEALSTALATGTVPLRYLHLMARFTQGICMSYASIRRLLMAHSTIANVTIQFANDEVCTHAALDSSVVHRRDKHRLILSRAPQVGD